MKTLAVLFALLGDAAVLSWRAGSPTAINGVIGAGLCAVAFACLAAIERR